MKPLKEENKCICNIIGSPDLESALEMLKAENAENQRLREELKKAKEKLQEQKWDQVKIDEARAEAVSFAVAHREEEMDELFSNREHKLRGEYQEKLSKTTESLANIIKEQKAEIEWLKEENEKLKEVIVKDKERWLEEVVKSKEENKQIKEIIQSMAGKDFYELAEELQTLESEIERLKALFPECYDAGIEYGENDLRYNLKFIEKNESQYLEEWKKEKGL